MQSCLLAEFIESAYHQCDVVVFLSSLSSEVIPDNYATENPFQCFKFWFRTTGSSTDLRVVDVNAAFGQQEMWRSPTSPSNYVNFVLGLNIELS